MVPAAVVRYTLGMTVIDWNGADLPAELRRLPAGKYVIQRADDTLTPDEDDGLVAALDSLRAGRGVPHEVARDRLLKRARH